VLCVTTPYLISESLFLDTEIFVVHISLHPLCDIVNKDGH